MDDPHLTRGFAEPAPPPAAPSPAAAHHRNRALARTSALPWLLFLLAATALGWLAWHVYGPNSRQDPSGISAATLEQQNRLVVLKARLSTVTVRTDKRFFGMLESLQIAVIPASVDYYLDLSKMGRDRLAWNEQAKTLDVRLPAIRVEQPSLDVVRARYFRQGAWITGQAQEALYKANAQAAARQAMAAATSSSYVESAKAAARSAVKQNLAIPLKVAGYGDVTVRVRFDGEKELVP